MRAFHATKALDAILTDGWVRPMRMAHTYAFTERVAAEKYAVEFGYEGVVEVEVDPAAVVGRWKPSYANGAVVLKCVGALRTVRTLD